MNDEQRATVRDTARYLHNVRPIDPGEIHEYVEGEPHPAAVREVLRENAVELGLIERSDGTFTPVEAHTIDVDAADVPALPEGHERRLEECLVDAFGPGWPESDDGDRLRDRVRTIKRRYHRGAPVDYDHLTVLGYAIYHLPGTFAAAHRELAALAADGLLSTHLRVLDVGAGVGGQALALFDLLPEDALVEYHAIEPSAAAEVLEAMLAGVGPNVHPTIHRTPIERADLRGLAGEEGVDLAILANVLNEIDEPAATLSRVLAQLAPDGTALAIAPADRTTATGLRRVERAVVDEGPAGVYAPPLRLWPGRSPSGTCWSFDVGPDIDVPAVQRRLEEAAAGANHESGEFVNADVQYAYTVLRRDDRRRTDVTATRDRYAPMAEAETYVTDRINLLAVKLSHDLSESGHPLYLIGDGSEAVDHFAVRTDGSSLTDPVASAEYGAVLHFENVLVLWNDDEEAYNVVLDEQSIVEPVAR
jgi:SAM-dependent methyltransferase